jgi:hypothetical protein
LAFFLRFVSAPSSNCGRSCRWDVRPAQRSDCIMSRKSPCSSGVRACAPDTRYAACSSVWVIVRILSSRVLLLMSTPRFCGFLISTSNVFCMILWSSVATKRGLGLLCTRPRFRARHEALCTSTLTAAHFPSFDSSRSLAFDNPAHSHRVSGDRRAEQATLPDVGISQPGIASLPYAPAIGAGCV